MGRSAPSLAGIALYIGTVIAGTAAIVLLIRVLTDSWAAGGMVGAIATGLSVGGYIWLMRTHDNRPRE